MKKWRKLTAVLLVLALVVSMAACGGGGNESSSATTDTSSTTDTSTPESETTDDTSDTSDVETTDTGSDALETPRNETLYIGGRQWSKPTNNNPLSPTPNFTGVAQNSVGDMFIWEAPYMWNPITGECVPLLADGEFTWNDDQSVMTFKIKAAAAWNDGTPVTANDVAATWKYHVLTESLQYNNYGQYISDITATDDSTVQITLNAETLNPLQVEDYVVSVYVMQEAYLDEQWAAVGEDATEMKNATFWDAPTSGPYTPTLYDSEQKWVCTRDDNYWGQDESMWGQLPVPKYLAHNIYKDNAASQRAFEAGEIDANQQYCADINLMWEEKGLPISTWNTEPPYQLPLTMPSAIFNTTKEGLDQVAVRTAIAMAIDYDQIVESAMTGQSPTFADVPRSLFNPTDAEQALIKDPSVLEPYQYPGKDIEGANKVLDDAGIVDTDGDGIREYPAGNNLSFKCQCPNSYSDWQAALTIVSACGADIGIQMETDFVEVATFTSNYQTGNFDICMGSYQGTSPSGSWKRAYQTMYGFGGEFPETAAFNYGRYYNPEVDEILNAIPTASDEEALDLYEKLNLIYLQEVPAVSLMYRPQYFHEVNETVWTNYPEEGNEKNIPPMYCCAGYGIAALYELELVEE